MLGVFELLKKFNEDFGFITNFLNKLVDGMSDTFKYVTHGFNVASELVTSLPDWLQVFGIATTVISLGFVILGRSTGGYKND